MRKIEHVGRANSVFVQDLLWSLQAHEDLWNRDSGRTKAVDSPHSEVDDIWVRYAEDYTVQGPHESVWYPAAEILPVKRITDQMMLQFKGLRLGGVLITRIKAGHKCKPHADQGWHAGYYDKYAVQIQSAPGQWFRFEDAQLEPRPGDIYKFDNSHTHWVENDTPHDRITMIVCIRTKEGV